MLVNSDWVLDAQSVRAEDGAGAGAGSSARTSAVGERAKLAGGYASLARSLSLRFRQQSKK